MASISLISARFVHGSARSAGKKAKHVSTSATKFLGGHRHIAVPVVSAPRPSRNYFSWVQIEQVYPVSFQIPYCRPPPGCRDFISIWTATAPEPRRSDPE